VPEFTSGVLEGVIVTNSEWSNNVRRLLGLHDVSKGDAARLLGVSPQAVSEWTSKTRAQGTRDPNLSTLQRVADFFELSGDLAWTPFAELLDGPLSDPERFKRVEDKIRGSRSTLKSVDSGKATGQNKPRGKVEKSEGR
jgi:transcriptional regulator with XRE-family HTH domain